MNRRIWTGIVSGVVAATVVLSVAFGAYRAGQHDDAITRTAGDGEVVRVVDGHGWGNGPGPGFLLFPLLGIAVVILLVRGGRRWGDGGGPGGPGYCGYGPSTAAEEWHRRAHESLEGSGAPPEGRS